MLKENLPIDSEIQRLNDKIISSLSEPIYTSSTSINNPNIPIVVTGLATAFSQSGHYFTISTGAQLSGTNNYLYLQIAVPPHWTKEMHIDRLRIGSTSTSNPSILEVRNLGTTPLELSTTPITPINTNFTSLNTSPVTAGYVLSSTNISTGDLLFSYIQTAGTTNIELDGRVIIANPTASTIYFYLKLIGSTSANCILSCSWWEDNA